MVEGATVLIYSPNSQEFLLNWQVCVDWPARSCVCVLAGWGCGERLAFWVHLKTWNVLLFLNYFMYSSGGKGGVGWNKIFSCKYWDREAKPPIWPQEGSYNISSLIFAVKLWQTGHFSAQPATESLMAPFNWILNMSQFSHVVSWDFFGLFLNNLFSNFFPDLESPLLELWAKITIYKDLWRPVNS